MQLKDMIDQLTQIYEEYGNIPVHVTKNYLFRKINKKYPYSKNFHIEVFNPDKDLEFNGISWPTSVTILFDEDL